MPDSLGPVRQTRIRYHYGSVPSFWQPDLVRDVIGEGVCAECYHHRVDRRYVDQPNRLLLFGWHVRSDMVAWDRQVFCSSGCRFMYYAGRA